MKLLGHKILLLEDINMENKVTTIMLPTKKPNIRRYKIIVKGKSTIIYVIKGGK